MVISKKIVILGFAESAVFADDSGALFDVLLEGFWFLAANPTGSALYLIPMGKASSTIAPSQRPAGDAGAALFEEWHGFPMSRTFTFTLEREQATLHKIGYIREIIYKSNKWKGGSRFPRYKHDFESEEIRFYRTKDFTGRLKGQAATYGIMGTGGEKLLDDRGIIA